MNATSTVQRDSRGDTDDVMETIMHLRKQHANKRKLRLVVSRWFPFEPRVIRTKSFEVLFLHPFTLNTLLADMKISEEQMFLHGMSYLSPHEYGQLGREFSRENNERTGMHYGL